MSHEGASVPSGARDGSPDARISTLLVLALLALAGLAYANAVFHPFVYDDVQLVLKNPNIRSLSSVPALVGFEEEGFRVKTRWTRDVTYAFEYALGGPKASLFHLTNVVLHGIVGLLVFTLIAAVSRSRAVGWWAAALFVVHPIHTEVVAHVAGRRGLLAALFALSALVLLEGYTRIGGRWRLVAAFVSIYLGVFSKELAVVAPVLFVALDLFTRLRDEAPSGAGQAWRVVVAHARRRAALYGSLAVFTVALVGAVVFLSRMTHGLDGSPSFYDTRGDGLGLLQRLSLVGLALRLLLVPLGQTVDYSYDALGFTTGGWVWLGILNLGLVAGATALAVRGTIRRSWAALAAVWFVLFYLPHLGIIRWHEVFAERFLYLPSIGIFAGVAAAGVALARSPRWSRATLVTGLIVLATLTVATTRRNQVWSSSEALWHSAVDRYPGAARAHKALADAYKDQAKSDLALEHYTEAVRILPAYHDAMVGIAVTYAAKMEFGKSLAAANELLERWPNSAMALNLRGYVLQTLGRPEDAFDDYSRAVEVDPTFSDGYNNLAMLYVERGDIETAVRMYNTALEHNPALITAWRNLAIVYRKAYEDEEKATFYDEQADRLMAAR